MLRRLRRLKLSLATKCQLLFGVAAGIIILAALYITWERIEQLTRQQDSVAAETLAKQFLAQHAEAGVAVSTVYEDAFGGDGFDEYDAARVRRPRLVGTATDPQLITPFEQEALDEFAEEPNRITFARFVEISPDTDDRAAVYGLRLALAARGAASCLQCHRGTIDSGQAWVATRPGSTVPRVTLVSPVFATPATAAGLAAMETAQVSQTEPEAVADLDADLLSDAPLLGVVSVEIPTQVSPRQRLLNRVFLICAALAAALTAALTLYFILTRLILTPVRVLQETAEKVREGDLNVRADIASGDEFETLALTLNSMVAGMQSRNEQLAKANRSLDNRLGQLAEANVALDESNRLKGEFLANVSHELRTPLNSILGFADLVKSVAKENPKVTRYAGNIATSGQALLELINDLLDLAKIEAGKMEIRRGELSVQDVFEALATLLAPLAHQRQVRIVTQVGTGVPIITTDAGKLQQVLYNLLSNAIKFSPTGGRIDVVARLEPDTSTSGPAAIRLTVTDQGPGIDPKDHERIFEKFRQLDSGVTREHAGTGLGLAISRELANLLGGTLGVDSRAGAGATFWLHLPVVAPTVAKPREKVQRSVFG